MHMPSLTPPGQVRMINKLGDSERVFQVLKEGGRKRVQVYIKEEEPNGRDIWVEMMGGNCADLKPAKGRSEPTNVKGHYRAIGLLLWPLLKEP